MTTILYIEDEEDMAELVRRNIERAGHAMIHASSSEEGLRLAERERPQLILLDIGLGVDQLDGWEVNKRLKGNPVTATIPVIALTAHTTRVASREKALKEGFAEHHNKPIDFIKLLKMIDELLLRSVKEGS